MMAINQLGSASCGIVPDSQPHLLLNNDLQSIDALLESLPFARIIPLLNLNFRSSSWKAVSKMSPHSLADRHTLLNSVIEAMR